MPTGSTTTAHDGMLYVAEHNPGGRGTLHSYDVEPDGSLRATNPLQVPVGLVPANTQGVTTDGERWYAVATTPDVDGGLARESYSEVVEFDPGTGEVTRTITDTAAPLSQGVVLHDGQLDITNEGIADPYVEDVRNSGHEPAEGLQRFAPGPP